MPVHKAYIRGIGMPYTEHLSFLFRKRMPLIPDGACPRRISQQNQSGRMLDLGYTDNWTSSIGKYTVIVSNGIELIVELAHSFRIVFRQRILIAGGTHEFSGSRRNAGSVHPDRNLTSDILEFP